jgi:hypothetical protein
MSGESKTNSETAELEALLLNRLNDNDDMEFDIEDVRAEFAKRMRGRHIDDTNQPTIC